MYDELDLEMNMEKHTVETIVRRFNESGVRYVVVGGVAVAAHGYMRFTADLDLMLDLENSDNVRIALEILKDEGYVPRIPVPIEMFADAEMRESWVRDKNMLAYGLDSEKHPMTHVDLFAHNVLNFEGTLAESKRVKLFGEEPVVIISFDGLIYLKELAGRAQDKLDIEKLRLLQDAKRHEQRDK